MPRIIFFALLLGQLSVASAESANGAVSKNPFLADWPRICRSMIGPSLSMPELEPIMKLAPIAQETVCGCIESRFRSDKYLQVLFVEDNAAVLKRMNSPTFGLYIRGKGMSHTMACMSAAIEHSVNAIYPGQEGG